MSTVACKCGLRCSDVLSWEQDSEFFTTSGSLNPSMSKIYGAVNALRVGTPNMPNLIVTICLWRVHPRNFQPSVRQSPETVEERGGTLKRDERGRHPPGNKTSDVKTEAVKEHINSFPQFLSHYSRKDNLNRRYVTFSLPSCIACTKMSVLLMDVRQSVIGCTGKYSMKVLIWSLAGMLMFLQSLYSHLYFPNTIIIMYTTPTHAHTHAQTHTPARTDTYDHHFLISLPSKVWYMSYMWCAQRERSKWFGREESVEGWAGAPSP